MTAVKPSSATARRIGQKFANAVRDEPAAQALSVSSEGERVELWLLTEPTDAETEQRLYAAGTFLEEEFADVDIRVHVLNPAWYGESDPKTILPEGAERIWSR